MAAAGMSGCGRPKVIRVLLSATMDKAFDSGLMTITTDKRVRVARQLIHSKSTETAIFFAQYEDVEIRAARRFDPDPAFLEWHHRHRFVDSPFV